MLNLDKISVRFLVRKRRDMYGHARSLQEVKETRNIIKILARFFKFQGFESKI